MAGVCCEVATGSETEGSAAACDAGSRAARRRRMEIRRLRVLAGGGAGGVEVMAPDGGVRSENKRRRTEARVVGSKGGSSDSEEEASRSVKPSPSPSPASWPKYGVTSVCGRRRDMEDAVSLRPGFVPGHHFFAVFDGHGCSHVATSCGERMHEIMAEEAEAGALDEAGWRGVMERSFARMDAEAVGSRGSGAEPRRSCRCEMQLPKCDHVGSTAVVAVVGPKHIAVANCGDSRAVLCRRGVAVPLSSDHKPDRPDELERIQSAGGRVIFWDGARVFGMLAMSRAIGDSYLKPFVISEPEVQVVERKEGEDEFLILASDGLWDVVSNEVACNVVRACLRNSDGAPNAEEEQGSSSPTSSLSSALSSSGDESPTSSERADDRVCAEAAMLLTKLALARQSADNVSVVVVNLRCRRL